MHANQKTSGILLPDVSACQKSGFTTFLTSCKHFNCVKMLLISRKGNPDGSLSNYPSLRILWPEGLFRQPVCSVTAISVFPLYLSFSSPALRFGIFTGNRMFRTAVPSFRGLFHTGKNCKLLILLRFLPLFQSDYPFYSLFSSVYS